MILSWFGGWIQTHDLSVNDQLNSGIHNGSDKKFDHLEKVAGRLALFFL